MRADPNHLSPRPSLSLVRAMQNHRFAYRTYDHLVPQADRHDRRFDPDAVDHLSRSQRREERYRRALLSHPISSLVDMQTKAKYLLGYSGDDYLITDMDELALLLRSMTDSIRPRLQ